MTATGRALSAAVLLGLGALAVTRQARGDECVYVANMARITFR